MYYVTIIGNGSFSLGPRCPIWRGPNTYEISAEQAEGILAVKEAGRVDDYVIVSTVKPDVEPSGSPDWVLRPQDLMWNRTKYDPDESDLAAPDADYEPQDDEFPCEHCSKMFTSESGLAQHIMLNHFNAHEQVEDEIREQLAAEKAARRAQERVSQASSGDPKSVRPEERLQDRERP